MVRLFGTVKLVRNTIKRQFTYNGWKIAFDGEVSRSFVSGFARNVRIFDVDNSLSSYTSNWKNNFLILGEGINDTTGAAEKPFLVGLVKQIQSFTNVFITMMIRVTCM